MLSTLVGWRNHAILPPHTAPHSQLEPQLDERIHGSHVLDSTYISTEQERHILFIYAPSTCRSAINEVQPTIGR